MKRAAAASVMVLLATWSWEARGEGQAPSASEVVSRNAAARGGVEAWRSVETMTWVGHVESPRAPGSEVRFRLEQRRPNKTRLEIDAPGQRSVRVFDGDRGWKAWKGGPGKGEPEPYTPQELEYAQAGHGIDGPLMGLAARGGSVMMKGIDEIAGRRAYHLALHYPGGIVEDVWVDADTYLDLRHDRTVNGPGGGKRRVSVEFGDYRTVDRLTLPFLLATGHGPDAASDRMVIETVLVNPPMLDSAFRKPGSARTRGTARRVPSLQGGASTPSQGTPGSPSAAAGALPR